MSRTELHQSRQLTRLRDMTLDAALRDLAAANAALADATARLAAAVAARDAATAALARARGGLADDPAKATQWLARIADTEASEADAIVAADAAADDYRAAEAAVVEARTAVRLAKGRAEAMTIRTAQLGRTVARRDDERESIESEEGAAAMRTAA